MFIIYRLSNEHFSYIGKTRRSVTNRISMHKTTWKSGRFINNRFKELYEAGFLNKLSVAELFYINPYLCDYDANDIERVFILEDKFKQGERNINTFQFRWDYTYIWYAGNFRALGMDHLLSEFDLRANIFSETASPIWPRYNHLPDLKGKAVLNFWRSEKNSRHMNRDFDEQEWVKENVK